MCLMKTSFRILGGNPISGQLQPMGNKNAALPMLASCLLTDEPVLLHNLPDILDVRVMLEGLQSLNVDVEWIQPKSVRLHAGSKIQNCVSEEICQRVRTSILFAGPLLARTGAVTLSPPGGDVIGRRRLDPHFTGLRALGVEIHVNHTFEFKATKRLSGQRIFLDEASVTATENLLMAASTADGTTTIINAACEPHVQDLCRLLNKMGAQISGIGTNRLTIEGVEKLHGTEHEICPDHIEIGSFVALSAISGGELKVNGVVEEDMWMIRHTFAKVGINFSIDGTTLTLPRHGTLEVQPDIGNIIPTIDDGPWPQFPSDLMSPLIVAATQAKGPILFHEKMFESRMFFIDRLVSMGAGIILCDPHRCVVTGTAQLHMANLTSPDIRAGMAILMAALVAEGESIIQNADMIDRGYEQVDQKLRALGADIERISPCC